MDRPHPAGPHRRAGHRAAPQLREWIAGRTVEEITGLAAAFRVPSAPVSSGESVTGLEHLRERGVFRRAPGEEFLQPGWTLPALAGRAGPGAAGPRAGQHSATWRDTAAAARPRPCGSAAGGNELPYAGLWVLDLTAFWPPSATHVLAMLGAEVIHVESTTRPDGARMIAGIPVTEDQWWEKCPSSARSTPTKEHHGRLPDRARPGAAAKADRRQRRYGRELHAAGP